MRKIKWIALSAFALALTWAAARWIAPSATKPPDPATQGKEEAVQYLASKSFTALPEESRQEYLEKLMEQRREGSEGGFDIRAEAEKLPEAEREAFHQNVRAVFQARMLKEAKQYCALPAEMRQGYIDGIIDRMGERFPPPPPPGATPPNGAAPGAEPRRGPTAQRIKERIETTPPETRAVMGEFMKAMRKRMEERGIRPPGRPN